MGQQSPDLSGHVKKEDVSKFLTISDLAKYVRIEDLKTMQPPAYMAQYALKTDVVPVDLSPYAKSTDFAQYTKSSDLTGFVQDNQTEFTKEVNFKGGVRASKYMDADGKVIGQEGMRGPQGPAGEKGDKGVAGSVGSPGDIGPVGKQGPDGPVGTASTNSGLFIGGVDTEAGYPVGKGRGLNIKNQDGKWTLFNNIGDVTNRIRGRTDIEGGQLSIANSNGNWTVFGANNENVIRGNTSFGNNINTGPGASLCNSNGSVCVDVADIVTRNAGNKGIKVGGWQMFEQPGGQHLIIKGPNNKEYWFNNWVTGENGEWVKREGKAP